MYKKADNMLLNAANGLGLLLADRLGIGADRYMSGVQTVNDTANNIRNGVRNIARSVGDTISKPTAQSGPSEFDRFMTNALNNGLNPEFARVIVAATDGGRRPFTPEERRLSGIDVIDNPTAFRNHINNLNTIYYKGNRQNAFEDKLRQIRDQNAKDTGIVAQLGFVGDALADSAKNAVEKGKRAGKKVADRVSSTADAAVEKGKRVGKKVADRVSDAADDAVKAAPGVVNAVERTLADAGNAAAEAGKNMLNAGRDAAKTVGTAVSDAAKTVGTAAGDAADFIREGVGGMKYMVTNPVTGINAYDKARNDAAHATLANLAAIEAGINRQNQEGIEVADQNAAYKKARRTAIAKEMQRIREETARETSPFNIAKNTVNNVVDNVKNTAQDAVGRVRGLFGPSEEELRKQRFKQLLMRYAPWTVGGALVGGITGGLIGGKHKRTLLGSILGSVGGAGLATAGKYAYDKYMNKHASADYIDHRVRLKQKLQANYK